MVATAAAFIVNMLLYFVLFWKALLSLIHAEVHSGKKSFRIKAIFFLNNHEIYPPSPSPRHSSLANLFQQGVSLAFFAKKKEKKEAWSNFGRLKSTVNSYDSISAVAMPTSLGRTAEKRPRPLYGAVFHSIYCPLVSIVNVAIKNRMVLHHHCGDARHCLGHVG